MTRWIRGSDISSVKASVWGTQPIHFNVYVYLWCAPSNLSCLTPVWTEQRRCELLFPMQPNTRSTCRIPRPANDLFHSKNNKHGEGPHTDTHQQTVKSSAAATFFMREHTLPAWVSLHVCLLTLKMHRVCWLDRIGKAVYVWQVDKFLYRSHNTVIHVGLIIWDV